jgi:hypothetical protein
MIMYSQQNLELFEKLKNRLYSIHHTSDDVYWVEVAVDLLKFCYIHFMINGDPGF